MLVRLVVENLGVIESARIPLSGGMSALTGETGAGKTMLVDALRLLVGERADPSKVRPGASEAVVEGLFVVAGDAGPDVAYPDDHDPRDNEPVAEREWVLRRVVPAEGRSRSYVNGALATAASVGEMARGLLEIHGQHAQQALLEPAAQRDALDRFAGIDPAPTRDARRNLRELTDELAGLGGDERELARHMELLEYQLEEIAAVAPIEGEDAELEAEEDTLASAVEYRSDAARALDLLTGGGGESADVAAEQIARARSILGSAKVFEEISSRLAALGEELADCAADLRNAAENIEPDHERLAEVRSRRQALVELRRKYGATVTEILEFESERKEELAGLRGLTERRERLGEQIAGRRPPSHGALASWETHAARLLRSWLWRSNPIWPTWRCPMPRWRSPWATARVRPAGGAVEIRLAANRARPVAPSHGWRPEVNSHGSCWPCGWC
ncbi:MAG: AAA family ATPase [Microthrixaceae bacterium]